MKNSKELSNHSPIGVGLFKVVYELCNNDDGEQTVYIAANFFSDIDPSLRKWFRDDYNEIVVKSAADVGVVLVRAHGEKYSQELTA